MLPVLDIKPEEFRVLSTTDKINIRNWVESIAIHRLGDYPADAPDQTSFSQDPDDFIRSLPYNDIPLGIQSLAATEPDPGIKKAQQVLAKKTMVIFMDYERLRKRDEAQIHALERENERLRQSTGIPSEAAKRCPATGHMEEIMNALKLLQDRMETFPDTEQMTALHDTSNAMYVGGLGQHREVMEALNKLSEDRMEERPAHTDRQNRILDRLETWLNSQSNEFHTGPQAQSVATLCPELASTVGEPTSRWARRTNAMTTTEERAPKRQGMEDEDQCEADDMNMAVPSADFLDADFLVGE